MYAHRCENTFEKILNVVFKFWKLGVITSGFISDVSQLVISLGRDEMNKFSLWQI